MNRETEGKIRAIAAEFCREPEFVDRFIAIARGHEYLTNRVKERVAIGPRKVKDRLRDLENASPALQERELTEIARASAARWVNSDGVPGPDGDDLDPVRREMALFLGSVDTQRAALGFTACLAESAANARELVGEDSRGRPSMKFRLGTIYALGRLFQDFGVAIGRDRKPEKIQVAQTFVELAALVGDEPPVSEAVMQMILRHEKESPTD